MIILFLIVQSAFSFPITEKSLRSISSGPGPSECDYECEHNPDIQFFNVKPLLENNDQVISLLSSSVPPSNKTKPYKYSITIDIPAYDGKKRDQVRADITPFDLNDFFYRTGTNIDSYSDLANLEHNIIYNENKVLGHTPSDSFRHQVKEQMDILQYTSLMKDGEFSRANTFLSSRYKGATTEEKISFLGSLLSRLNENYDFSRLSDGFGAKTISLKDLSGAIFYNNDGITKIGEEEIKAGVCRHMHQFAVKAARQMGLDLSFGVSYPNTEGYHLSMVATDPDNPGRTYKLNYGNVKKVDGEQGQMVLDVNYNKLVSNGVSFHLWGKDRQPVYFSPSERGVTLAQIAGEDLQDFDVNIRPTAKKVIAGLKFSGGNIQVFHSMTNEGLGEHLSGLSFSKQIDYNSFITGSYGVVGYHARKESDNGEYHVPTSFDTTRVTSASGLYFYIGHDFHVNIVEKKDLSLKLFSRFTLRGTGFLSRSTVFEGTSYEQTSTAVLGDGSGQLLSGFTARFGQRLQLSGVADVSGQTSDINDMSGFSLYARRFSLISDFSSPIGAGLAVSNSTNFNFYPLDGNNIATAASHFSLGTMSGDRSVQIGVLYPLQEITPSFIPGSRKTVEASIRATFFKEMFGVSLTGYFAPSMSLTVPDDAILEDTSMDKDDYRGPGRIVTPVSPADFGIGVTIDGNL